MNPKSLDKNKTNKAEWGIILESYKTSLDEVGLYWEMKDFIQQTLSSERQRLIKEIEGIVKNIRRFDEKENGIDFYAGWDSCLDTVGMDIRELLGVK